MEDNLDMATWMDALWTSDIESGAPRGDRRSGAYRWYLPDSLDQRTVAVGHDLARGIARAERAIRSLNAGPAAGVLVSISRFLLRSEAIASSRIEGVAPSAKNVALAELGQHEAIQGISDQARLVANNLTIVHDAASRLSEVDDVTLQDIVGLHTALLPDDPKYHGIREVQNWIGGSDYHPINADFVPPEPNRIPELMNDLVRYLNGAAHSPLVQAALVHAQFETIHPFTDGNGRVGRALIHTVLTRRGLTPTAVLPVSLVLSTLRGAYIAGLTECRYSGPPHSEAAMRGLSQWVETFTGAALTAADQSRRIAEEIQALQVHWKELLANSRVTQGRRPNPRADSGTASLLGLLPAAPVLTSATVQRVLDISTKGAIDALSELHRAGILESRKISRGVHAFAATDLLNLLTVAERRLASTKFDTRSSPPNRPVPSSPEP